MKNLQNSPTFSYNSIITLFQFTLFHPLYKGKNAFSLGRSAPENRDGEINDIVKKPPRNWTKPFQTSSVVLGSAYKWVDITSQRNYIL